MMTDIPAAAISVAGSGPGMTSYIICAFVSGFLLATVIFWIVTRQLQKDWMAEYRRLMGGIDHAYYLSDVQLNDDLTMGRDAMKTAEEIAEHCLGILNGEI